MGAECAAEGEAAPAAMVAPEPQEGGREHHAAASEGDQWRPGEGEQGQQQQQQQQQAECAEGSEGQQEQQGDSDVGPQGAEGSGEGDAEEQAAADAGAGNSRASGGSGGGGMEDEDTPAAAAEGPSARGDLEERPATSGTTAREEAAAGGATHRSTAAAVDLDSDHLTLSCQPSSSLAAAPASPSSSVAAASRPMSALLHDLRGSRPNSAAVAAQIEGFDADFAVHSDCLHHTLLEDVPELEQQQENEQHANLEEDDSDGTQGLNFAQAISNARREQAALTERNESLQRQVRQVLEQRSKGRPVNRDLSRLDGADARYRSGLKMWCDLRKERGRVAAHYQTRVLDLKASLEGRVRRAEEIAATFAHFKREVCLAAEQVKTGRPMGSKALAALEARDHTMEEELQRVRLKNIHLSHALKKLEATIRDKEQLAEGLHLIDFEQLKIENHSLNEKIEERNEELLKLRKKTAVMVQILTHMREKLHYVEGDNSEQEQQLAELEAALASRRDELAAVKTKCDKLRREGRQIREQSVFVYDPVLLADMQALREKRDDLLAAIEAAREQHAAAYAAAADTS